uniref:Transmembrane protein 260 n=1 Tax=Hippocampus comes TaxID=109280 RepID=A0A3Q2XET5_HIPCM
MSMSTMATEQKTSWILTGATVACVLALYVPSVQRTVPGGDSGWLLTTVAHPPGYPLFTLLARMAMCLLPTLSPAHSVNLMSSVLGAVASPQPLLSFAVRLVGPGPGAALAGGVFAVSRLSWQWSVVAEVFTLNNLFTGLLVFSAASFHSATNASERRKVSRLSALTFSNFLSRCPQNAIIPWCFMYFQSSRGSSIDSELSLRSLMWMGMCFLLGFLPYIFLPFSSYMNAARWSWGDQTTISGLLTHLLRAEYGTFSLVRVACSDEHLSLSCTFFFPALFLFSCSSMYRSMSWLLISMLLLYSLFFAWRANLDISRPLLLGVVERFWIQGDAILCVLAGLAAVSIRVGDLRECDQSNNSVVERFGRELLASFPTDSIILTRGDLPGNSLRYLHYCLDVRPDVRLVDQEMMTYSWYVKKLGAHLRGVHFPGQQWDSVHSEEKGTFNLEQFLMHNSQRDVFACIGLPDGDPSWGRSFSRWPFGVCDFLVPARRQFRPKEWASRTHNLYNWSEPHNRFHSASWERVANEEMWQARYTQTVQFKMRLHFLYKALVESASNYPSNWDKNLALACERLLRSGHQSHSPDTLLTCSIQHFSLYLDKEPTDPQATAIRSAVAHLLKERARHRQSLKQTT